MGLSAEELHSGGISLFDGQTLFGWQAESDANWRVEDGCIVVDQGSEPGLLRTTSQFDNYVLELEFRAAEQTNSGVFVRTSPRPTDPTSDCVEINIAPESNPFPTGSVVGREKAKEALGPGVWRKMKIEVGARRVGVFVDGKPTVWLEEVEPSGRGYVGLQFNSGEVRFRNIRLWPTQLETLINSTDLAGWNIFENLPGKFEIADGVIRGRGGPGQLESEHSYADFVLQFKCRLNAEGLNSGVFFRCIPGEQMNGYEVQIDNATIDGDRNRPKNGGTGAIFRRNEVRRVMSSDLEWMAVTLAACGPHFAVWVNGRQVTDWTDQRPDDANPRKGRRLDAGTIILQLHDETTDVSFAGIAIAELSPRKKADPQRNGD